MANSLTIVQVMGRLGIGGVESHVTRLSAGLVDRGHTVLLVVQDPDDHGDDARALGIDLVTAALNREGLVRAIETLRPLDVHIVHAHNYRPARFGAPLAYGLNVPYLMSVHGPRAMWKRALFVDWSDRVLTASEADRDNIRGAFGVRGKRIEVGFYGVDTERYRPGLGSSALRDEWGVPVDVPLVLNVSRFTHRKARPALMLIEALPEIRKAVPGTLAVFVGAGERLERIVAAAERLNASLGERVAIVAGPRTDIPAVMNAADVVVATATTASESLATSSPTIAFGRTGYFGIVTPDSYEAARAVCFADHGRLPKTTTSGFAADVIRLLSDLPAARQAAGAVRQIIAAKYTVDHMIDHIEGVYRSVIGAA
jgi:glycosyltransferase involved in cell wall biosynthesis